VRTGAYDWIRRQRSLRRGDPVSLSDFTDEQSEMPEEASIDTTPLSRVEDEEMYTHILDLINELPERYRDVFVLKHIENISYVEIAEILGVSTSAVEARLFRARTILREKLSRLEE
jgi:RNA polymerase sigma-70 factor (ECF subfamily)